MGVLLGAFMGGMCLGSLLLPRLIPRSYHPLRVYALLEIAIGLFGIIVLYWHAVCGRSLCQPPWHGVFSRALIAAVCLVIPASLMGATLPVVARFVESTPRRNFLDGIFLRRQHRRIGIPAASWPGFYLLRLHDMSTATYAAVALNLAVALIALALARKDRCGSPSGCACAGQ